MDGHQWLQDYQRRVREIGARAAHTQAELSAIETTASSRDGAVTVTVDPGGALRRLVLGERADGLSRAQLASAVLSTAREAHEQARHQMDVVAAAYLRETRAGAAR